MSEFRKTCPVCKEDFSDLIKFMEHIKKNHREIPPNKIFEMGKEQKWKLRS
jgi:hypothetical protein